MGGVVAVRRERNFCELCAKDVHDPMTHEAIGCIAPALASWPDGYRCKCIVPRRPLTGRPEPVAGNPARRRTRIDGPSSEGLCAKVGHLDAGEGLGGLFEYRTSGDDRQHPERRGAVRLERIGFECARCGAKVLR